MFFCWIFLFRSYVTQICSVGSLPETAMRGLGDLMRGPPPEDAYTPLKAWLLAAHTLTEFQRISRQICCMTWCSSAQTARRRPGFSGTCFSSGYQRRSGSSWLRTGTPHWLPAPTSCRLTTHGSRMTPPSMRFWMRRDMRPQFWRPCPALITLAAADEDLDIAARTALSAVRPPLHLDFPVGRRAVPHHRRRFPAPFLPPGGHRRRRLVDTASSQSFPIISEVFAALHGVAHPGIRASRCLIAHRFLWKGMRADIANWCRDCQEACQRRRTTRHPAAAVQPIPVPSR
jgi:hypothetical protein